MTLYHQALARFQALYKKAQKQNFVEPTHMILATADRRGRPSARVVLLKHADQDGFVFYTNHHSRKGRELLANPYAALVFFWDPLDHQIRVEGVVQAVSIKEADAYWRSRPRDSQIGGWASLQSESLDQRQTFLQRFKTITRKYKGKEIPRPPHWSGFRIRPTRIEFWKKKPFRLHERWVYEKKGKTWAKHQLYP